MPTVISSFVEEKNARFSFFPFRFSQPFVQRGSRQIGLAGMCLELFSRTKKRHSGRDGTRAHRVGNTCSSTTYFSNGALYKLKANCFVVGEIVTVTIYFHFYIVLSVFLTIILSSKQKQKTIDYSIALLNGIAGRGISPMRY